MTVLELINLLEREDDAADVGVLLGAALFPDGSTAPIPITEENLKIVFHPLSNLTVLEIG